jgi:hypothetical protein
MHQARNVHLSYALLQLCRLRCCSLAVSMLQVWQCTLAMQNSQNINCRYVAILGDRGVQGWEFFIQGRYKAQGYRGSVQGGRTGGQQQ